MVLYTIRAPQRTTDPGINQPEPFPGYAGFVGWESPVQLRDSSWLVGFNAGYWHASLPTPLRQPAGEREEWLRLGMPLVDAPTGGRCMLIRSTGGHHSEDARGNGIWCIRLRVRPDHAGIDLLPAPDLKP